MRRFIFFSLLISVAAYFLACNETNNFDHEKQVDNRIKRFNNITLEMSLKPFKKNDPEYINQVCREVYRQWYSLLRHADTVSVMLWTADGSEILDYSGNLDQPLEWAKYIGNPNTEYKVNSNSEDESLSVHQRAFTYLENPPGFKYQDLKNIVNQLKSIGMEMIGKPVRVGATFDPGPEFAKSPFKYEKHPEICMGNTMGTKTFVCCYATLNEDPNSYAGYPNGITQDTPFGTFFGRQSQHFLTDIGFDYLWLSNGFGFGMETWSATGAIYDGKHFYPEKIKETKDKIIEFWTLFREECPGFRIETRGTNLSTGIDLAADGVDLRSIYNGGYNILPPPNSPWAALNGDFGLELAGYMSRIAVLPDNRFLFRYYTHDPWWVNSPWMDRYGREAHDIYLPMSISTINQDGSVMNPTHLSFLTIDDSYGNMPVQVPDEVIPHILQARRNAPDQPGLVVWVYPFDEYHNWASHQQDRLAEIYFGDWFIRQAINEGFPLNTVVSTTNFIETYKKQGILYEESILVTIVPESGSQMESELMDFIKGGGKVIVYGPLSHASDVFLKFINVAATGAIEGEIEVDMPSIDENLPKIMRHPSKYSGGGIESVLASNESSTRVIASVSQGNSKRDVIVLREHESWNGGAVCYVRGTNSVTYSGGHLLTPDDPNKWFSGPSMMRYALHSLGFSITFDKSHGGIKRPVNCISRNDNAFFFSGYLPNLTVEQHFKFPQGAPVIIGWETELKDGASTYRFPKSFFEETRFFVEQKSGIIACKDIPLATKDTKRRIQLSGLEHATIRFYPPENLSEDGFEVNLNANYPFATGHLGTSPDDDFEGNVHVYKNITGQLIFSW